MTNYLSSKNESNDIFKEIYSRIGFKIINDIK